MNLGGQGLAGTLGTRRLRLGFQSERRILPAHCPTRLARRDRRGPQRRRDTLPKLYEETFRLHLARTTCPNWPPHRRRQYSRDEFLRLLSLVAVANVLSQQAAASGEKGPSRDGLDSRPVFHEGLRLCNDSIACEPAHVCRSTSELSRRQSAPSLPSLIAAEGGFPLGVEFLQGHNQSRSSRSDSSAIAGVPKTVLRRSSAVRRVSTRTSIVAGRRTSWRQARSGWAAWPGAAKPASGCPLVQGKTDQSLDKHPISG